MFKFWNEISSKTTCKMYLLVVIEKHMTDMNQNTKTNQYTRYVPRYIPRYIPGKFQTQSIHQVCTPSRAALLTGRWPNLKYGINHNLNNHLWGFWQNIKTCSTLIRICGFLIIAPMLDTLSILVDSIVHWNPSVLVVYPQVKGFFLNIS